MARSKRSRRIAALAIAAALGWQAGVALDQITGEAASAAGAGASSAAGEDASPSAEEEPSPAAGTIKGETAVFSILRCARAPKRVVWTGRTLT